MKRPQRASVALALLFFAVTAGFPQGYTPLQLSIVPGIGIPFGTPDAGIVLGPIGNISGKVDVLQAAGVFNIADRIRGIQAAGVFNITGKGATPLQVAGVFNIGEDIRGIQVGGVFNIAEQVEGLQVGSIFNIASDVIGTQVGLVNIADEIHGLQIGLVNIASNGVLDLFVDWEPETKAVSASLRTGTSSLFAVYSASMPAADFNVTADRLIAGLGLGTRIGDSESLCIDLTVSASQLAGPDLDRYAEAWETRSWDRFQSLLAPWPTLGADISLDMGWFALVGGVRVDVDLAAWPNLPAMRKVGTRYADRWFDQDFVSWTTWHAGIRF